MFICEMHNIASKFVENFGTDFKEWKIREQYDDGKTDGDAAPQSQAEREAQREQDHECKTLRQR